MINFSDLKIIFLLNLLFLISCDRHISRNNKLEIKKAIQASPKIDFPVSKYRKNTFHLDNSTSYSGILFSKKPISSSSFEMELDTSLIDLEFGKEEIKLEINEQKASYYKLNQNIKSSEVIVSSRYSSSTSNNYSMYLSFLEDTTFVNLKELNDSFIFDIAYATENNFTHNVIYNCDECLLRWKVAKAILEASYNLEKKGYRFIFYDCYRPIDAQKKLWEKVPNPTYVANPYTRGSIHSRGGAVDISIADKEGWPLDMGTEFDYFGREARHAYLDFDEKILDNRKLLKETMESVGFRPITSEWWHYNFKGSSKYPQSNLPFECDE